MVRVDLSRIGAAFPRREDVYDDVDPDDMFLPEGPPPHGHFVVPVGDGEWLAYLGYNAFAGEVVDLVLLPNPNRHVPAGGLTPAVVRSLPLSDAFAAARNEMESRRLLWSLPAERIETEWSREEPDTRPGRASRSNREYAELAAAYVAKMSQGSRNPTRDLAEELGYSAITVNQRIREARRRGLLTAAPKGRAGGTLTAKARRLLQAG